MNQKKLQQLFAAARRSPAPEPSPEFATDVLRVIRRLPPRQIPATISIFDQLNAWFPRIAIAAAVLIVLCVALELNDNSVTNTASDDEGSGEPSQVFFSVEDV